MQNLKVGHWVQMALGLVLLVLTWVLDQQAHGALALPASVMSALLVLKTVLGLLTPSVIPSTNIAAVAKASLRPPPLPGPIVGMLCLALAVLGSSGCGFLAAAVPGVIDIVDAECAQAEKQPIPGWLDFLCTVANPKPGEAKTFTYRVKQEDAPQFASMHTPKGGK
jgi:hypothetical protein